MPTAPAGAFGPGGLPAAAPGMMPAMGAPGMMAAPGMMPMGPGFPMMPGMMMGGMMSPAMPAMPAFGASSSSSKQSPAVSPQEPELDPDVKKLCDEFQIESECAQKLQDELNQRQDTRESDVAKLYELLDDVGSPSCLLALKIEEMQRGEFVGRIEADREVEALALNFSLGVLSKSKLNEVVARRPKRKGEDLVRLEAILERSREPDAAAKRLADRLISGSLEALPDLGETEDVIRKFKLDETASQKLVEIIVRRPDDSSLILGGLEVYLEATKQPSAALTAISGRLLAGGEVPDEPKKDEQQPQEDRGRDRRGDSSRSRPQAGGRGGRSRSPQPRGGGRR